MQNETQALVLARIQEVERRDDDQILALMTGELVTEYVYSFDAGGRKQEGLSWAGVRELAAMRGNIILDKPDVDERDDHWRVMVRATDLDRNISVWGGTHQPKFMSLRNGNKQEDPFAFEKALSKAQRNAIKNLLPMTVVKGAIASLHEMQRNGAAQRVDVDRSTGEIREGQRTIPGQSRPASQPKAEDDTTRFFREVKEMGYTNEQALKMLDAKTITEWTARTGKTVADALAELRQYKA